MSTDAPFHHSIEDGVAVVTLNRPHRLNAVNWDMAAGLVDLFRGFAHDDDVHVIVLTGAGGAFCAGGDAEFLSGEGDRALPGMSDPSRTLPRYQRKTPAGPFAGFAKAIVEVEKPVIAAIQGVCVGAGLAYALACDRRFADSTTRMAAIFVQRGFSPDCGLSWFLPRIVPLPVALNMVSTGRILKAPEAHRVGLIDELVEDGTSLEAAMAYAKQLAQGPSVAIDIARRCVYKALTTTLDEILDYEAVAGTMVSSTQDATEGVASFLEKRKPVFKGV